MNGSTKHIDMKTLVYTALFTILVFSSAAVFIKDVRGKSYSPKGPLRADIITRLPSISIR